MVSVSMMTKLRGARAEKLNTEKQEESQDPLEALSSSIPGTPGQDYPIYSQPPETSFACDGYVSGYYADTEARCQAYHVCAEGGRSGQIKYTFLCPNGTLFHQAYFICDWWFNVDCSQAVDLYSINFEIEAERKAEKIDLNGAGAESDQSSSSSSFVAQNSNTDPFRSGPIDFTL